MTRTRFVRYKSGANNSAGGLCPMAGAERLSSMAQRVQVVLEDDLDGGKADETVLFGLDGTTYEIDLSKKNAAKLRDALAGYVGSARRVSGRRGGGAGRARGRGRGVSASADVAGRARGGGRSASDSADIRAWAKEKAYKFSELGRSTDELRAAFNEAK